MARTGPQRYPGASTAYWYGSRYPGSAMESNVGALHTTEGTTVPTYGGGASAPNFTLLPDIKGRRLKVYQHFDFDVSSRALVNRSGGVQTNTANAVQFELVGTCDPKHRTSWNGLKAGVHYLFWPDAPDWALAELGKIVRWCHDEHGVRLASTVTWKAYPGSYGANGVRLTGAQWNAYYGWLGHQHVPENDHGDPGNLNFARVLEHAKDTAQEDDMPLTTDDVKKVADAVFTKLVKTDGVFAAPKDAADYATNKYWAFQTHVQAQTEAVRQVRAQMAALTETNKRLVDTVAQLAAGLGDLDPAAIVAELTSALESIDIRLDVPQQG